MSGADAQKILTDIGDRLAVIIFDNNLRIGVNVFDEYGRGTALSDLSVVRIGDDDFIQQKRYDYSSKSKVISLYPTAILQGVIYTENPLAPLDFMSKL